MPKLVKAIYFKILRIFFLKTTEFTICFYKFALHKNKKMFLLVSETFVKHK